MKKSLKQALQHRWHLWLAFWGFMPIQGGALGDGDAWDETTPSNSTLLSDGDDHIRDVRKGIRIRMEYEHATLAGSSVGGKHKFMTMQTQAVKPTVSGAQTAALYVKDVGAGVIELFYEDEAANEIQVTSGAALNGVTTPPSAASQVEMEAASSTTVYTSPGRTQYHPGVVKGWAKFNSSGTISASHNVTSITDNGTGDFTVNWGTDFSSANYAVSASAESTNSDFVHISNGNQAAGSVRMLVITSAGVADDPTSMNVMAVGDQA